LARLKLKKWAPNGHFNLLRAATPDQIIQQNSLHKESSKDSKGILWPDFQANISYMFCIFKANATTSILEGRCNLGVVTVVLEIRQFRANE
jgi:hypothetical protein